MRVLPGLLLGLGLMWAGGGARATDGQPFHYVVTVSIPYDQPLLNYAGTSFFAVSGDGTYDCQNTAATTRTANMDYTTWSELRPQSGASLLEAIRDIGDQKVLSHNQWWGVHVNNVGTAGTVYPGIYAAFAQADIEDSKTGIRIEARRRCLVRCDAVPSEGTGTSRGELRGSPRCRLSNHRQR